MNVVWNNDDNQLVSYHFMMMFKDTIV